MNNLVKITTLILIVTNAVSIAPSLAMEKDNVNITRFERPQLIKLAESTERHHKDEFSKPALERMFIDEDLVRDVSEKVLTVNYAFESVAFNPCQDISWTVAKFYYQLQMAEKFQNVNYIVNNQDLINAIDNNKKYNVMFMDNCMISISPLYLKSTELSEKLRIGNVDLGEILLLMRYKVSSRVSYPDFLEGIKLILDKCSVQTIKSDSSLFKSSSVAKYFSEYYGKSLVSKIGEDEGKGGGSLPYIRKPDFHLYLDLNQSRLFSAGHGVHISSIDSKHIFSFNLMNSGSFNITCINTQKPYDRRVFSTQKPLKLEPIDAPQVGEFLSMVSGWFGRGENK